MKILTIHGYIGNAHNAVYSALHSLGVDTISPQFDYSKDSPEYVFAELRKILDENQVDMITGTSLGGFFALTLAIERDLPVMLINPCLTESSVSAADALIPAAPSPASFENTPLATPQRSA